MQKNNKTPEVPLVTSAPTAPSPQDTPQSQTDPEDSAVIEAMKLRDQAILLKLFNIFEARWRMLKNTNRENYRSPTSKMFQIKDTIHKQRKTLEACAVSDYKKTRVACITACSNEIATQTKDGELAKHRIMSAELAMFLNILTALITCPILGGTAVWSSIYHQECRLGFFNSGETNSMKDIHRANQLLSEITPEYGSVPQNAL